MNTVSDSLMKLRPIELECRELFSDTAFFSKNAVSQNDLLKIIEKTGNKKLKPSFIKHLNGKKSLIEDEFFQQRLDISAIQHARYLPAMSHTHQFFEMACVLSGTFTHFIGDQKTKMCKGDIIILAPNTAHAIYSSSDDSIMVNILMRSTTFEQHFLSLLPDNDFLYHFFVNALYGSTETPYLLFHTGNDQDLAVCSEQILREYQRNNRYQNTMLTSLLSVFFVLLLRKHEKDVIIPTMDSSVMNENTIFIIEYMQKNYDTVTLAHLAEFFNYSRRQMQRIILTATGRTFTDNIRRLRMDHAKELLAESRLSVQKIADLLGYYDVSNFRRVFKQYCGMTPQDYRKSTNRKVRA